jgi:hypothetical protein
VTPFLVVVDRVEEEIAVVELAAEVYADVPLRLLPPGTGEGDRLLLRWQPAPPSGVPSTGARAHGAREALAERPESPEAQASKESDHAPQR